MKDDDLTRGERAIIVIWFTLLFGGLFGIVAGIVLAIISLEMRWSDTTAMCLLLGGVGSFSTAVVIAGLTAIACGVAWIFEPVAGKQKNTQPKRRHRKSQPKSGTQSGLYR